MLITHILKIEDEQGGEILRLRAGNGKINWALSIFLSDKNNDLSPRAPGAVLKKPHSGKIEILSTVPVEFSRRQRYWDPGIWASHQLSWAGSKLGCGLATSTFPKFEFGSPVWVRHLAGSVAGPNTRISNCRLILVN